MIIGGKCTCYCYALNTELHNNKCDIQSRSGINPASQNTNTLWYYQQLIWN